MKLCTRISFIQQIDKDGEEIAPQILLKPCLFPTLEEVKESNARQLAVRKEKKEVSKKEALKEESKAAETEKVPAKGKKLSPSTDNPQWLNRLSKKEVAKSNDCQVSLKIFSIFFKFGPVCVQHVRLTGLR